MPDYTDPKYFTTTSQELGQVIKLVKTLAYAETLSAAKKLNCSIFEIMYPSIKIPRLPGTDKPDYRKHPGGRIINGKTYSAAGAVQFISNSSLKYDNWNRHLKQAGSSDFMPYNQCRVVSVILRKIGCFEAVMDGDIEGILNGKYKQTAISLAYGVRNPKANFLNTWGSMPGGKLWKPNNTTGAQFHKSISAAQQYFDNATTSTLDL